MSINLIKKREEKVKICLEKKFKPETEIVAKVNLVLDVSGSMINRYNSGEVQEIVERIYPIASVFDDDKELDMYIFNNNFLRLQSVTIDNYEGYVKNKIVDTGKVGGGTNYNPVISDIVCENRNTEIPVYNIFITDGDNWDKCETTNTLISSSNKKIFWQFVGIGGSGFPFLRKLDNMGGRVNDNANFFEVGEISNMSDEELYDKLLNEFPSFLENYKNVPIETIAPPKPTSPRNEKAEKKGFLKRLFG